MKGNNMEEKDCRNCIYYGTSCFKFTATLGNKHGCEEYQPKDNDIRNDDYERK